MRTVPGAMDAAALAAEARRARAAASRASTSTSTSTPSTPSVGRANPYAAPGGPSLDALLAAIAAVFDRFEVAAAALTAYDPRVDGDGAIAAAARRIAALIAGPWRAGARQQLGDAAPPAAPAPPAARACWDAPCLHRVISSGSALAFAAVHPPLEREAP